MLLMMLPYRLGMTYAVSRAHVSGADHDIELLRPRDELHRSVVDDHVAEADAQVLVLLGYPPAGVEEETVAEFLAAQTACGAADAP